MNDDFSSIDIEDREQEEASLRRRKLRENAAVVKKPFISIATALLTLIFLGIAGFFGFVFMAPEKVVNQWPDAMALYEKVGIYVYPDNFEPRPNVEIKPYASSMVPVGDVYKLTVSGHIVNRGQNNIVIPAIIGSLKNASGEKIYTWSFCLSNRQLVHGQGVDYEYEIMAAPVATTEALIEIKWEKDADGVVIDTCPPLNS